MRNTQDLLDHLKEHGHTVIWVDPDVLGGFSYPDMASCIEHSEQELFDSAPPGTNLWYISSGELDGNMLMEAGIHIQWG